jgi:hypothetical protein
MTTTSNSDSGMFKVGDIVVGSSDPNRPVYSATGGKLIDNGVAIYGRESDLSQVQKEMYESMSRSGGKRLYVSSTTNTPIKKKAGKKSQREAKNNAVAHFQSTHTISNNVDEEVYETPKPRLQTIQFENSFGKMKAKVEHVVEHETAFMLVFSDSDAMVFEPKTGESLSFYSVDRERYDVYYPGVTFDSPDSSKKYMILFKLPEEN